MNSQNSDNCNKLTESSSLIQSLQLIDPILQFLTRRTGLDRISLPTIYNTIPKSFFTTGTDSSNSITKDNHGTKNDRSIGANDKIDKIDKPLLPTEAPLLLLQNIQQLSNYNILALHYRDHPNPDCNISSTGSSINNISVDNSTKQDSLSLTWDNPAYSLGFPLPTTTTSNNSKLHGSTKVAAKRRMAALRKILQQSLPSTKISSAVSSNMVQASVVVTQTSREITSYHTTIDESTIGTRISLSPACVQEKYAEEQQCVDECEIEEAKRELDEEECFENEETYTSNSNTYNVTHNNNNDDKRVTEAAIPNDVAVAMHQLLGFPLPDQKNKSSTTKLKCASTTTKSLLKDTAVDHLTMSNILPQQISYAGSTASQESIYATLSDPCLKQIPKLLLQAFHLDLDVPSISTTSTTTDDDNNKTIAGKCQRRLFYSHQVQAIEAVMDNMHCSVCTGTGSGKSICYLLPALTAAYNNNDTSMLLYPTKALAQDQLSKIISLIAYHPELQHRIRPITLDGDTTHITRSKIHEYNIILTNPDILHTTLLPSWKQKSYQQMFSSIRYVAIDEAHIYDGIFGAHVAMILRRLVRITSIATCTDTHETATKRITPTFISTSATLPNPAEHFQLLCPIQNSPSKIIGSIEDGSPRSAKHFLVWNPPVLHLDGTSTGKLSFPKPKILSSQGQLGKSHGSENTADKVSVAGPKHPKQGRKRGRDATEYNSSTMIDDASPDIQTWTMTLPNEYKVEYRRRHAAEETALLLARAVILGTRCIAFCKTRNLVEWVYTKTIDVLNSHPTTKPLSSKVESYRGGYTVDERRKIEEKLFQNRVLGVVGTNALELGVDIGGIDLTLHCGYPSSYTSLLQQAGRAGRGGSRLGVPSIAIVVCFSSPSEQQLWRRPASLLSDCISSVTSIPFQEDLVEGHLLCASEEFPLCGEKSVSKVAGNTLIDHGLSDNELFGESYGVALRSLVGSNAVSEEKIVCQTDPKSSLSTWKARVSFRKAWSRLSIRSIEPIHYAIVDMSHPSQGGRTTGPPDSSAVLDTIPYSRVFYHAHPGAIITHRGKKYEIVAMTQPPIFEKQNYSYIRTQHLAAYVRPTTARYFTRPLAKTIVTIVKQFEVITTGNTNKNESEAINEDINFAGCGIVSVKRQVRGYKKLSYINFSEIARTELSLPPIEFDTFGFYMCADPNKLSAILGDSFGPGIHALSHAILAVSPLFATGLTRGDIECDHSFFSPNKIILFDERAGGSGCVQRLWKSFFRLNGILECAVDLLKNCSSCSSDPRYEGGCPACIHASQCSKFNMHLSRSAAIVIGERMIERMKETDLYKQNNTFDETKTASSSGKNLDTTPRRKARNRALQKAKEMQSSRDRQFVVARPSWPLDGSNNRLEHG